VKGTKGAPRGRKMLSDVLARLRRAHAPQAAVPPCTDPDTLGWIRNVERHAEAFVQSLQSSGRVPGSLKLKGALLVSVLLNELRRATGLPALGAVGGPKRDLYRIPPQQPVGLDELVKDGPIAHVQPGHVEIAGDSPDPERPLDQDP
jgi:hypothetical protein